MGSLNSAAGIYKGITAVDRVYKGTALVWDGVATSALSKASTLSDSFDSLDSGRWTIYPGSSIVEGELALDASSSYSTVRTKEYFSIEGSGVRLQVNQLPNISNGSTQAWMDFRIDTSNYVSLLWSNGSLLCRMVVASVQTDLTITYDFAAMRLWRLREAAGDLYWETSSDEKTWTTHRTVAIPSAWVGKGGQVSLVAGNWNSATDPGRVKFDNLNVADFSEAFTAADGSVWNTSRWNLSPLGGAATDINLNRGRLSIPDVDGAMVRTIAKAPAAKTQSLLMSYTLTDTTARSWIQIWLRGDGTWSGNKPGHGYAVEIQSDATSVAVLKYNASTQTSLSKISSVNSLTAGQKQWLRFEVTGSTIRYRIWLDGTVEPTTWTASVTDIELSAPGYFQVCTYRSINNVGAKTVYFDDITLAERLIDGATDTGGNSASALVNEQFDGSRTVSFGDNTTNPHPNLWIEWSGCLPVTIGSGVMNLSGNSISGSSADGFHRMFSRVRYGGPGKSLRLRYRARMTALYDDAGWGGYRGVKMGMKFPQPESITGYSEEDPQSVKGAPPNPDAGPGSMIFVTGIMEDGRTELARNGYGTVGYLPFQYGPKIPYTINTWKDITVQVDWIPGGTQMRIRYWQNSDGSGEPIFDWTDPDSPFQEPGFLWYRTDFSDFEYDYMIVEEI